MTTDKKKLTRSRTDAKVLGICGGLAVYLDLDPTLVRLAALVLGLVTGVVPFLVIYFVAAIVVPSGPAALEGPRVAPEVTADASTEVVTIAGPENEAEGDTPAA